MSFLSNFFVGLKSIIVSILLTISLIPNLYKFKLIKFKLLKILTLNNFVYYILIPGILLISSSDINFHYDAAYYHLNHQNWLRESNLIIGMVNIFWPFGMSSIYEYISSLFWFKDSLIYLHFISLVFFHFFFSFLYYQIFQSNNKALKNASFFIIIYSFLDNFGVGGGRNGFLYIQEVGKQDTAVAILICFVSLILINYIIRGIISQIDFIYLTLISFFIFQLKVSGVFIFYSYFILVMLLIREKKYKIKNILFLQLPTIIFGALWTLKSFLTTNCFIFPLTMTCLKNLSWYEPGSTKKIEEYTTNTSFAYMEYFLDPNRSFMNWFNDFFNSGSVFSAYYQGVYLNFLFSITFIYFFKKIFFSNLKQNNKTNLIIFSYIAFAISYLVFYGPIPRYSIGILCTIVGLIGFYVNSNKIQISKNILLAFFLISLSLVPRINSYTSFIKNTSYSLFDPRIEAQHNDINNLENWYKPESGDRCWINLNCTMEEKNIIVDKKGFFKIAYKK